MDCNHDMLQAYLDRELEPQLIEKLTSHLTECRECRRELSQLKLMWLELAQEEEIDLPPELPFLRQQAISAGRVLSQMPDEEFSYWRTQKQAWEPFALAVSRIPGTQTVGNAAKMIGQSVPMALGALGRKGLKAVFRGRSL